MKRFAVELTASAERDLEALFDYVVATRSPAEAHALLDRLIERVETLETFPDRGAIPAELDAIGISDFRQLLVVPYRVIYRVVGRKVFILVIADGRRDMQELLERRLLAE